METLDFGRSAQCLARVPWWALPAAYYLSRTGLKGCRSGVRGPIGNRVGGVQSTRVAITVGVVARHRTPTAPIPVERPPLQRKQPFQKGSLKIDCYGGSY